MKNLLKNWKTTLFGVLTIVLSVLVSAGIISPDESKEYSIAFTYLFDHLEAFIAAIAGVVLIFSKDYDNKEHEIE